MSMLKNPDRIQLIWQAGEAGRLGADSGAILLEDRNFEISGTSAADGSVTYDADQGFKFTTAGGSPDDEQVIMLPQAAADSVSLWREIDWAADMETEWETVIRTDALIALMRIEAGLVLTMPSPFDEGTDIDQVKFSYLEGTDTNWQCNISINNTDTTADSGVLVTATSVYHFALRIDPARICRFFINDRLVHTTTALTAAANFLPTFGVQAGTETAAVTAFIRAMAISRRLTD